MTNLRDIFAYNLKNKRRNFGISQAQLAERVNVSTHHIATIETARNYPTLELVERIANALNIEIYELFIDPLSPPEEMERLYQTVAKNIEHVVSEAVERAVTKQCLTVTKDKRKRAKNRRFLVSMDYRRQARPENYKSPVVMPFSTYSRSLVCQPRPVRAL